MLRGGTGLLAALALFAAPSGAAAQQPDAYGGGVFPPIETKGGYVPTVGITLQPGNGTVAVRMDTTVRCGRDVYFVSGTASAPASGSHVEFTGTGRQRVPHDRLDFQWAVAADLGPSAGNGVLTITGTDRRRGHVRSCNQQSSRPFQTLLQKALAGVPAAPPARALYLGLSDQRLAGGLRAPVLLRASANGRRVAARWGYKARCRHGGPLVVRLNYTPAMRVDRQGAFGRTEHFKIRFRDSLVRYEALFDGTILSDGAHGALRLKARVFDRGGRRLIDRCATGVTSWQTQLAG
jgi:hypothetical protein